MMWSSPIANTRGSSRRCPCDLVNPPTSGRRQMPREVAAMLRFSTAAVSIIRANRSAQVSTALPGAGSFDATHDALRCIGLRHALKLTPYLPMT